MNTIAMTADFTNNVNPADRRFRMIAEYIQQHDFKAYPMRNFSKSDWLKAVFRNFDIIHTRCWPPEKYVVRFIPHKHMVTTVLGHFIGESEAWVNARKFLCKRADLVHIGYMISKKIIMDDGVPEEKIRLIHNPIDTNIFVRKEHSNRRIKVLYVSAYLERKNPWIVVQLAKNLPNIDFIMYGTNTQTDTYKQIFDEAKSIKNLSVNGTVDYYKLPDVYQSADMFIFPSTQGEFGNVVIEALASGLPVISMRCGAEEIIRHGEDGFLCNDLNEFGEYIEIIAEDESLLKKMGKEARKTAVNEFSQEVIFRKFLDMYREVLGEKL